MCDTMLYTCMHVSTCVLNPLCACATKVIAISFLCIIESVDSISRDGPDIHVIFNKRLILVTFQAFCVHVSF